MNKDHPEIHEKEGDVCTERRYYCRINFGNHTLKGDCDGIREWCFLGNSQIPVSEPTDTKKSSDDKGYTMDTNYTLTK